MKAILVLAIVFSSGLMAFTVGYLMAPNDGGSLRFDTAFDPPLGTSSAFPRHDILGRAIPRDVGKTLLVFAGTCTSCSVNAFRFDRIPYANFNSVIVVLQGTDSDVRHIATSASSKFPKLRIISDNDGSLGVQLNAVWQGRWYIFDHKALISIQKGPDDASYNQAP